MRERGRKDRWKRRKKGGRGTEEESKFRVLHYDFSIEYSLANHFLPFNSYISLKNSFTLTTNSEIQCDMYQMILEHFLSNYLIKNS